MSRITYQEAHGAFDGNSTRRFLENVAAGRYWKETQDFNDGRSFDPPELQAQKASVILQELDAQIAKLTSDPLDRQAQIMLLRLEADMKFDEAVTKPRQPQSESKKVDTQKPEPEPKPETELSGEEKLKAARRAVKGLL